MLNRSWPSVQNKIALRREPEKATSTTNRSTNQGSSQEARNLVPEGRPE